MTGIVRFLLVGMLAIVVGTAQSGVRLADGTATPMDLYLFSAGVFAIIGIFPAVGVMLRRELTDYRRKENT